jgi:cell wall-associated NlpC family hydrolase
VNPWEAQALLAPARQLTPQAHERDRLRVAPLILPSLAALALAGAPSAAASSGGGSMPGGATSAGGATEPSAGGATQPSAGACTSTPTAASGGAGMGATSGPSWQSSQPAALPCPRPTVAGTKAQIIDGLAYAPADAPIQVQDTIWAGDRIRFKPYLYGGGHGRWNDVGYDCSGSVSYVLHAAGLLKTSMDSSEFMTWDRRGVGQWITVYTNPAHAFIEIAGIRFDTSAEGDGGGWVQIPAGTGPRWRPLITSTTGFDARHPAGL